jgi:hypothetical protein
MARNYQDASHLAADPAWLPHRYDPEFDAFHFRYVPRAEHRLATFLTDEYLNPNQPTTVLARDAVMKEAVPKGTVHFIFHSAFCCSTLLARALDIPGTAMALKEPTILNDLVGWRHRGAKPDRLSEVLEDSLHLLSRPFGSPEATVIKPSNVTSGLVPAMMEIMPEAQALVLYAPIEVYLKSVAKKGMWGRLWVRDLLVKQLKDGLIDLGFDDEQYLQLTDLQAAAVGWLAQHKQLAALGIKYGAARVRSVDCELLLRNPKHAITCLGSHFKLQLGEKLVEQVVAGPAFSRHSKFDTAFDADARALEYAEAAKIYADEIEKVTIWIRAVAANAGVEMELPHPLW